MKFMFLFLSMTSISMASTCPDLNGTYMCKSGSEIIQKMITNTEGGYIINSMGVETEYHADGTIYEQPATDSYKELKISSICSDSNFIINLKAKILYEGSVIANQVSTITFKKLNEDLVITNKTKMKGIPLPVKVYNCEKIN